MTTIEKIGEKMQSKSSINTAMKIFEYLESLGLEVNDLTLNDVAELNVFIKENIIMVAIGNPILGNKLAGV